METRIRLVRLLAEAKGLKRRPIGFAAITLGMILSGPAAQADDFAQGATVSRTGGAIAKDPVISEMSRKSFESTRAKSTRSTESRHHTDRKGEPLFYHFRRGDTLAYRIEIEVSEEGSQRVDQYSGTPYLAVKNVEPNEEAEIFVIGKLVHSVRSGDGQTTVNPKGAIWLGSRVVITPSGALGRSKKDVNAEGLPPILHLLQIEPKRLIFPPLPSSVPGVRSNTSNGMLFTSVNAPGSFVGGSTTLSGRHHTELSAEMLSAGLVRVEDSRKFETDAQDGSRVNLTYQTVGRFDRTRGVPLDLHTTFREERAGNRPIAGTVVVRRLDGNELKQAYEKAMEDWPSRPADLEPIEFLRVRVAVTGQTEFFKTTADVRPGMAVVHLRGSNTIIDGDNHYYLADVVAADSQPNGQVRIRYRGSDEILAVPPATIAPAPK